MGFFSKRRESRAARVIEPASGIEDLLDLQAPPFAVGFNRTATNLLVGMTPGGRRYRWMRYSYGGGLFRFEGRVLVVDLPFALPDVFWTTGSRTRIGMEAGGHLGCLQYQNLRVFAGDDAFAKLVFDAIVGPTQELSRIVHEPIDLSVDRDHLVAVDPPFDETLPPYLAALDTMIEELAEVVPRRLQLPPHEKVFSFYGHPEWQFAAEGDRSVLKDFGLPLRLQGRVEDQLSADIDGVRMVAFRYSWLSEAAARAEISRGMVLDTDRDSEPVCAFILDARLPGISVNGEELGDPVNLGNPRFAETFALRSTDPQLAYQLFNERVQEWMLATHPYGWTVNGGTVRFHVPTHDALLVGECEAALHGWLDRIPRDLRDYLKLPTLAAPAHL